MFAKRLRRLLPETLQTLLDTLVEMELHFAMCNLEFGTPPTAQSSRKLYHGKYLHNLVSHEPIQLRLISGQSSNAENEERIFNAIKGITNSTSSYRPGHVITNMFLRLQAEK